MKTQFLLLCAATALIAGCQPPIEETEAIAPTNVEFTGQPDEAVAGVWKATSGMGTYTFDKSGTYEIDAVVKTPNGEMKTNSKGEWRIDGDRFLMKDAAGNVVPYALERSGDRMVLQVGEKMKHKTELVRQKW